MKIRIDLLATLFLACFSVLSAQTSSEFFSVSQSPIVSGITTDSQTARLYSNPDNPTGNTPGTLGINVTAAISNQQYTGFGTGPGLPVFMFGATSTLESPLASPVARFGPMNSVGSAADAQYTTMLSGAAQGIDITANHAFDFFTSVQQWTTTDPGNPATNSRVYMANLTLTFSSPVSNPYLHFVGNGGFGGTGTGFATELTLTSGGVSLSRLQGSTNFVVSGSEINNNAGAMSVSCAANQAGCGTVQVVGTGITTLSFQVFVRGDGGGPTWTDPANHAGDRWMLGVSLPAGGSTAGDAIFSGRVLDANGRAVPRATVLLVTGSGEFLRATTNPFGIFRFAGLEVGEVYTARVTHKRLNYAPRTFTLNDDLTDVEFIPVP